LNTWLICSLNQGASGLIIQFQTPVECIISKSQFCAKEMNGITNLNVSHNSRIGIGYSYSSFPLDMFPGWTADSWGYHGDDGVIHHGSHVRKYGPTFTTGDVIGCCLDFQNSRVFYTRNGEFLGVAFSGLECWGPGGRGDIYPCVGLNSVGERIRINLGKERFVFNISEYAKGEVFDVGYN
jgi:Ran-binding protein 9/10